MIVLVMMVVTSVVRPPLLLPAVDVDLLGWAEI